MNFDQANQAELISVLSTDAPFSDKARACQRLALIGDKNAVDPLAGLLGDEKLADFARIALQAFPFPEAGDALRKALASANGTTLAGVIDSLACREDARSVTGLSALIGQPESGALSALAKIATPEAVAAIKTALKQDTDAKPPSAQQAALEAAAELLKRDRKVEAARLLEALLAAKPPQHIADAANKLAEYAKSVRLFDGKTFEGWEGDLEWFRIVDAVIVAGDLTKPIPRNEFLATTREFGDFELRLKVRLRHRGTNGGIQFRSHRVPNSREMAGYQADAAAGYWGGIYDESRRATFLGTRADSAKIAAMVNPLGWNEYRIRCEGNRIRLWLNGILTSDFIETDASIPTKGFIAVQVHAGNPSEVDYKDVEITEFA